MLASWTLRTSPCDTSTRATESREPAFYVCSWHKPAVRWRAEHVRSARAFQTSTCSAIAKASSTSMPRYLTVLSILVCPSKSWTALRFPVADRSGQLSCVGGNACQTASGPTRRRSLPSFWASAIPFAALPNIQDIVGAAIADIATMHRKSTGRRDRLSIDLGTESMTELGPGTKRRASVMRAPPWSAVLWAAPSRSGPRRSRTGLRSPSRQ